MAGASLWRISAALLPVLLLLGSAHAAPTVRTDSSPICNSVFPACQAKCPRGQDYMFVCSAGNGPQGGPYVLCQCVAPAMPVGPKAQAASLVLANWPGSKACNDKTWMNDCTSQMSVQVDGPGVLFTPAIKNFANEACDPAPGVVIGPKGTQAAVSFPQYPIGLTSTGPDGTLTIDFSATAGDDPNGMDWSQCIVTYKIVKGTFLNPQLGLGGTAAALQQSRQQQAIAPASAAGSSRPLLLLQLLVAAAPLLLATL